MQSYHMHNFSIFLHQIDGKWYEFGYYEYTGDDFEGDMAKMDAEPRTIHGGVVTEDAETEDGRPEGKGGAEAHCFRLAS